MLKILRGPHFLITAGMFILGLILHYPEYFLLTSIFPSLELGRYAIERILFLLPVTYAGFVFGVKAGLISAGIALAIMLPRVFLISDSPANALLETFSVIIVGGLVNLWFEGYKKEKERGKQSLEKLEAAQRELRSYIKAIRSNEKRLASFKEVSDLVCQSLELNDVLDAAMKGVTDVMKSQVAQVFLLDEETQELNLAAYRGTSDEFAAQVNGLKLGEGFNGLVAQEGDSLMVDDACADPRLTRMAVKDISLHALIATPLRVKGRVIGTLCVARRDRTPFTVEDLELLYPIANHIAVAAENARLYSNERVMAEQIAQDASMEKKMRENLSFYLQQVTRAQEEERTRIARELHDETAQDLIALSRQVDSLISHLERSPLDRKEPLESLREQIEKTLSEVRRFSQDLRPSILDDLGLLPALEWLTHSQSEYYGIMMNIQVAGPVRRFPPEVELVLFRIAQEALRNVCKHAKATRAEVNLEFNADSTVLAVKDNGRGFIYDNGNRELGRNDKLGIIGMEERAKLLGGTLNIDTAPGRGTLVKVVLQALEPDQS